MRYRATEHGSDASGDAGTDAGTGKITFPYGTIRFQVSETRGVVLALVTIRGAKGGSALAQANVSRRGNIQKITQACAGKGLAKAPIDARALTTPSISG